MLEELENGLAVAIVTTGTPFGRCSAASCPGGLAAVPLPSC